MLATLISKPITDAGRAELDDWLRELMSNADIDREVGDMDLNTLEVRLVKR